MDKSIIYDIVKNLNSNLEQQELVNLIKDALKRGYSLGFIDGTTFSQGRPQSSNAETAINHYIEEFKNEYNINL